MSNSTPVEQAVIAELPAVTNYPESRDFVQSISRTLHELQTLFETPVQSESCMLATSKSQAHCTLVDRALSPLSDEYSGRKQASTHEESGVPGQKEGSSSSPPSDRWCPCASQGRLTTPDKTAAVEG